MLGFRTLRPIAARAFRPTLVQPWAYPLVTFIPRKHFHEFSEAGADHYSPDPESYGTTKKLAKIMGPMHNRVIVKGFDDFRESTKELKLDLRESFKEMKLDVRESSKKMNLELKEEVQGFKRDVRWLLGIYLGAFLVELYYENKRMERLGKFISERSEKLGAEIGETLKKFGDEITKEIHETIKRLETPRSSNGLF